MKTYALGLILAAAFFAAPLSAQNYTLKFNIVNHTGLNLYGIYVTDADQNNWGEDIIPNDRFEDDTVVEVLIPVEDETFCNYDIKIEDDAQEYVQFRNIDFCELNTLTFLMDDNGELYYTLE